MKVLVTGGTGFVGGSIRRELTKKGVSVKLLVRKKVVTSVNEELEIVGDVFDLKAFEWAEKLKDVDTVIHCAWYVKHSDYLVSVENLHCMIGTLELIKAISIQRDCTFIGLGTCFEYDLSERFLSPDTSENPNCLYAECKLAVKRLSWKILEDSSSSIIWARLFYLYGQGEQSDRLYPSVVQAIKCNQSIALTHGNQVRDYLQIDDAARQICDLIFDKGPSKVVNICSEKGQTIKEFLQGKIHKDSWHLLKFGMRDENLIDPPIIIGQQNVKSERRLIKK